MATMAALTAVEEARKMARALRHGVAQITSRKGEVRCYVISDVLLAGVVVRKGGEEQVISIDDIHQVVEVTGFTPKNEPILGRVLYQRPASAQQTATLHRFRPG